MIISWIKTLFKKKNLDNTTTSDISIIDTSFIRVLKLSELSYEDRLLVKQYIKELKYDDYESVLKYSDDLLNKSNSEIEFFMINLGEIIKDISSKVTNPRGEIMMKDKTIRKPFIFKGYTTEKGLLHRGEGIRWRGQCQQAGFF